MGKKELQELIERTDSSAKRMREIGEAYLNGDVLYDPVAAEAWLLLAIQQEENEDAVRAMELVARSIHGQEKVISNQDYQDIWKEYQKAVPERQKYLEKLLALGTKEQQKRLEKHNIN